MGLAWRQGPLAAAVRRAASPADARAVRRSQGSSRADAHIAIWSVRTNGT